MATGWGAVGGTGGAWGGGTSADPDLEDGPPQSTAPYQAPAPLYTQQNSQAASGGYASAFQPKGSGSTSNAGDLAAREAALNLKERELAAKEKKLKSLEDELVASGAVIKKKNWPWVMAKCGYPLLYHSIADEIPDKSKRVVREMYVCWWGLFYCLIWNFFCASTMLGSGAGNEKISSWFLAIIYALCGIPLSFWGWYSSIYNAAKNDSSVRYIFFFIGFSLHIGFCLFAAIGFGFSSEYWSFAGWITAFQALNYGNFFGVVYIIGSCFWSCLTAYCFWCLKDAYLFFRGAGGIEQAKTDAAVAAFRHGMQQQSQRQV